MHQLSIHSKIALKIKFILNPKDWFLDINIIWDCLIALSIELVESITLLTMNC